MLVADVGPDGQQHALALVVAGAVLVRLAEVADDDGPVDRADDLGEGDLLRRPGEHVAAAHAPLRAHQAGALEGQEDLLEVGLGEARALGDVAHRGGRRARVQGERQQRPAGVVTPGRHLHAVGIVRDGDLSGRAPPAAVRDRWVRRTGWTGATEGEAAWGIIRSSPTTAGPASRTWSRRCSSRAPSRPAWFPAGAVEADQVVLLVLDGLGWDQLQDRRAPRPDAGGHGRRADHQRRARPPRPPP